MVLKWADNVEETTTSTGTGTINLAGASGSGQTFVAGIGTGSETYYQIVTDDDYEFGLGTVIDGSPDTLSRDYVVASSNGDALVNWAAGTKTVRLVARFAWCARNLTDRDRDTLVQVEETGDDDTIRFDAAGSEQATITANGLCLAKGTRVDEFSTDTTLGGNSNLAVPTERAVKTYVDDVAVTDQIVDTDGDTKIQVEESADEDIIRFDTSGSERMMIDSTGRVFVGESANTTMTQGLTINQGSAGNEILTLRSSSVAHGLTTITADSTYAYFQKIGGSTGGLVISALSDSEQTSNTSTFRSDAKVYAPNTTKGTTAVGIIETVATEHDGSGTLENMTSGANLFAVRVGDSAGSTAARFIVDAEGDLHVDGSTSLTNFDRNDDAMLCRAFDLERSNPAQIIGSEWDRFVGDQRHVLFDADILAKGMRPEELDDGEEPLVNVTQLQRLHNGAIWQGYQRTLCLVDVLCDLIPDLGDKLKARLDEAKLPALPVLA